ncbi:hypothetical protein O181_122951 [Austropuccinia psidii MF-1]|uniref:Uncharacterized protein n=1 Tax=Austropuccinia psidii MF-1 TaxID=1389203 RepID=A0A9Q3Q2U9_9BASI|nr:hypothetical protein [Austropuccinia psidii MF-1]
MPSKCLSQPQVMTLLHGCCDNPAWNQVGANWPHNIFYGQLAPFGVLWPFGDSTFPWPFMASGHILPLLASLANFHIPNPRPLSLFLGLEVSFCLLGGSGPPSQNHPFSLGGLGPKWPNPMRPKGAKGGLPLAPKDRWVPSHNWPT